MPATAHNTQTEYKPLYVLMTSR